MSKFIVETTIDSETVSGNLNVEQLGELIRDLHAGGCDYDLDKVVFLSAMEAFIAAAEDRNSDADIKLEIDELVTEMVSKFRRALHGGE